MKSTRRPPLVLTDAEPETTTDQAAPPPLDALPQPQPERPMSERRRRRLAEEQRLAEAQDAAPSETPDRPETVPTAADLAIASTGSEPALDTPRPLVALRRRETAPSGRNAYLTAGLASALWVGGVAAWLAYEIGSGAVDLEPLRLAVYALIALAPAGLAIMLAHAVRQGAGLAAETRRAREITDALVAPTALAAHQTGDVLRSLRDDIDHASLAAERARADMALLREALTQETTRLNEAAETAGRTARRLSEQLAHERGEMQTLGARLDTQATGVIDAVERQSRMVVDASDLAQTQLREAEAALAARAADLAAAAGEAQDAARLAADDLARQTLRLENAGSGVAEQIQSVEEGLGQQRAALVTAAYALRTDQEDFSAQVESQRAQLTEQLSATRSAANELETTSARTTETIRDVVEAATDQFRALVDLSQKEADGFDSATKLALDKFETLAAEARDVLIEETRLALAALQATADQSRAAAAEAAELAQRRAERLGESLFEAAQKADKAADDQIDVARRVVDESGGLIDAAGQRAAERLEAMLDQINLAFGRIEGAITELDTRAARLPEDAQRRIESVRSTVEEGIAAISAASQKAAADTEALDVGFQERVRRNYDMLTEAVRLMGVVSGDAGRRQDAPPPEPPARPAPTRETPASSEGRGFGLRGRLRLAPAPVQTEPNRLDWSDLEQSPDAETPLDLDSPVVPPADIEALEQRIIAAIRRMGVDPNALLPRARIEEAASALAAQEPDQARQIVRRVAPAAVRSVSRRVLSDPDMRADAEAYVRAFSRELAARARAGDDAAVSGRLTTDGGRAFMLLDAAIGDLG